jgi:hypothetical protein
LKLARSHSHNFGRAFNNVQEISMHKLIAAALVSMFAVNVAFAQAAAPAAKPEAKPAATAPAKAEEKKPEAKAPEAAKSGTGCEEKAVDKNGKKLAGAAKNSFIKKCEKDSPPAVAPKANNARSAQRQKMAACNKDAGEKKLKGEERKAFMSTCLKG